VCDRLLWKGVCSGSHHLFKFWYISDNISKMVQDGDIMVVTMKHVAHQMEPLPMTLSDLQGHFSLYFGKCSTY